MESVTPKRLSAFSPEWYFAGAVITLCLALFFGNKFIAVGHGLFIVGILTCFVSFRGEGLLWGRLRPSTWYLLAFGVAGILSLVANAGDESFAEIFAHGKKLRFYLITVLVLLLPAFRDRLFTSDRIRLRDVCTGAWLLALLIACVIGLVGFLWFFFPLRPGTIKEFSRVTGTYTQPMTFAYSMQYSVLILAIFSVYPLLFRKLTRIPWFLVFPFLLLSCVALYFSYTKGPILSILLGLTVFSIMRSKKMILLVAAVAVVVGSYAYHQKTRYFEFNESIRINQWKTAGLAFLENPLLGVGFRNFEIRSVELKKKYGMAPSFKPSDGEKVELEYFKGHAHSNYMEAFASMGLIGGLAFLGFCFSWLREAWNSRLYAWLLVPLITAFLMSGAFENTFTDSEVLNTILLIYLFSQLLMDKKSEGEDHLGEFGFTRTVT